jgi:predicted Zn-dependent protease
MCRALHCVLFGAALVASPHVQAKTELLKTQPGSVVHWSRAAITVGIDPAAGSSMVAAADVIRALALAAQTWNQVRAGQPALDLAKGGSPDVSVRFCRGRWHGDTIDLGRSRFTASLRDGTVTAGLVEINECDHRFATPEQRTGYDLQAVLTHELGHVLGLGHSDNASAIMYPTGGGTSVRAPHVEDQTALALIYFGRAGAEPLPPLASDLPGDNAHPPARTSMNASLQGGTLPNATPDLGSGAPSATGAAAWMPPDSVSLLSFRTSGGRSVMVYTCEPTLLPPVDLVGNPGRVPKPSRALASPARARAEGPRGR